MENRSKINNLRDKLLTCGILVAVLLIMRIFDVPCVFNLIFKIPCPGCGMTRAYLSVLHLDFLGALHHHFMFWSVPVLLIYYFFDWNPFRQKWLSNGILILIGVGFLLNWICKIVMVMQGI